MTLISIAKEAGIDWPDDVLGRKLPGESLEAIQAASTRLAKHIRDGTVTVEQIDSFIKKDLDSVPEPQRTDILEILLSQKASLLFQLGNTEDGLRLYDEALRVKENPATWALKASALLQLERTDEGFEAYQKAYELRDQFSPNKDEQLADLLSFWSAAAFVAGLSGIQDNDLKTAETGAREYITVSERAAQESLSQAIIRIAPPAQISERLAEVFDEFELMVRLLSIKDPFEGWREFSKEISKVWPAGVSAVDEIREQRR